MAPPRLAGRHRHHPSVVDVPGTRWMREWAGGVAHYACDGEEHLWLDPAWSDAPWRDRIV